MYRPPAYAVDEVAELCRFIRAYPFATIAVAIDGAVQFAYAPVVLDDAPLTLRFHLATLNPLCAMANGTSISIVFVGPNAYVSPDWYVSPSLVPTWNYMAVEASGHVQRMDASALRQLLEDLSAEGEARLLPKPVWTLDKVPAPRLTAMMNAIIGFSVTLDSIVGKFKLSQDKSAEDRAGVMAGLEGRGDSAPLVAAMRTT